MARGRTRQDLNADRQFALAMTRVLEIVGEAGNRVTPETQRDVPAVPWPEIVGLRNRLIHGYDEVDFDILWNIVEQDLPALIDALDEYLSE